METVSVGDILSAAIIAIPLALVFMAAIIFAVVRFDWLAAAVEWVFVTIDAIANRTR